MVVLIEIAGWLVLGVALAGIVLNFVVSRREADHQPHSATRKVVVGCMIAGGVMMPP